jgi:hypothetical protein
MGIKVITYEESRLNYFKQKRKIEIAKYNRLEKSKKEEPPTVENPDTPTDKGEENES